MMPRGGIMSAIGGGLKKVFGDNPVEWALNLASMGGYEKAKYAKMLLGLRKKGSISNTAYKKVKSLLDASKKAEGQLTSAQGLTTSQKIAMGKGLESGAELLGLKGIEGQLAFKPGSSKDERLRTLHNQKTEGLFWNEQNQKEYEQLLKEDAEQTEYPKSVTVAHGGRIDKPFPGRSRDI